MMKKYVVVAVFFMGLCLSISAQSALGGNVVNPQLTQFEFYPEGDISHKHPVRLSFYQLQYGDDYWLEKRRYQHKTLDSAAKFLIRVIEVNHSDNPDDFLSLWSDKDKSELKVLTEKDPELAKRNASFYQRLGDTRLLGQVFYGEYRLFYVMHRAAASEFKDFIKLYVFKETGSTFEMTNDLSDDPVFLYLDGLMVRRLNKPSK